MWRKKKEQDGYGEAALYTFQAVVYQMRFDFHTSTGDSESMSVVSSGTLSLLAC